MGIAPAASAPVFVVTYGVWIAGRGWLAYGGKALGDPRREVAECAAALWGPGAVVMPVDESLVELQGQFLVREKEMANDLRVLRSKSLRERAVRWLQRVVRR